MHSSEVIHEVNLGREATFLTAMNVENHEIFQGMAKSKGPRDSHED